MARPRVSLIAAMSRNRIIGRDGDLPWHLPDDLRHFMRVTKGHAVIMGRRTFDSIGRKPLPDRTCFVVTRGAPCAEDVRTAPDPSAAIDDAATIEDEEIFIAGGEAIYAATLPHADRIYLTVVDVDVDGDTRFPEFDEAAWTLVEEDAREADERHAYPFVFRTYDRVR